MNVADAMQGVHDFIVDRQLEHFAKVHLDYAGGVRAALSERAKQPSGKPDDGPSSMSEPS